MFTKRNTYGCAKRRGGRHSFWGWPETLPVQVLLNTPQARAPISHTRHSLKPLSTSLFRMIKCVPPELTFSRTEFPLVDQCHRMSRIPRPSSCSTGGLAGQGHPSPYQDSRVHLEGMGRVVSAFEKGPCSMFFLICTNLLSDSKRLLECCGPD